MDGKGLNDVPSFIVGGHKILERGSVCRLFNISRLEMSFQLLETDFSLCLMMTLL